MSTGPRSAVLAAFAALSLAAVAACGSSSSNSATTPAGGGGNNSSSSTLSGKVAFLMPDNASPRYEQYDHPDYVAEMKKLCPKCEVIYANADADASKQQQQANSAIAQGVKVMVIDPVDSAAAATIVHTAQSRGVKVIAYDRPIPDSPPDFYISYDNEKIGAMISKSLIDHLKATNAKGGLLEVNGSPTDAAAGLIKKGVHSVLDNSGYKILAEYDTPDWSPAKAQNWVSGQISRFGTQIAGTDAANDGTGGAAVAAFKAAGQNPPPVTGNDATVAGLQLILAGLQYNTIEKPYKTVADAAGQATVALLSGQQPHATTTLFKTPSQLFVPTVVTQQNIESAVVKPGYVSANQLCTAQYAQFCRKYGVS